MVGMLTGAFVFAERHPFGRVEGAWLPTSCWRSGWAGSMPFHCWEPG
jgi:hypothetical protein